MKIAIAEHDGDAALELARALRREGHDVTACSDGLMLLRELRAEPELIIMSLELRAVSGWEMLDYLRRSRHRNVPVVVVGHLSRRTREMLRGYGQVTSCLWAPAEVDVLISEVDRLQVAHALAQHQPVVMA